MDCSLPGSSVHGRRTYYGIFQARVLEWVATAFSENLYYQHRILMKAKVKIVLENAGKCIIFLF